MYWNLAIVIDLSLGSLVGSIYVTLYTWKGRMSTMSNLLEMVAGMLLVSFIQTNHHPMHIHGHQFLVEKADGNPIAENNRILKNTILVATGETWDVLFKANNLGIWPFHYHISHDIANNFTDGTGGMFTTLVYKS